MRASAIVLTLNYRVNTADVDAVFERDKTFVKKLAAEMAEEFGLEEGWLNDSVKEYLSTVDVDPGVKRFFKTYPSEEQPGLRVYVANPEYLFAMKCRAMRLGGAAQTKSDIADIRSLAQVIGIKNSEEALALVESFYPHNMLEPKTRLGLEEIFDSLQQTPTNDVSSPRKP